MSKEVNDPVDQTGNASGEPDKKDVVAFETFEKVLKEKKNVQSRLTEKDELIRKLEEEKLIRENDQKALAEKYKTEANEWKSKFENSHNSFTWTTLESGVKSEALKQGCNDPDLLLRAFDKEDLEKIQMKEGYKLDNESLKSVVNEFKLKKPRLFNETKKKIANGNPSTSAPSTGISKLDEAIKTKDFSKLSNEELKELHKRTYNQ